MLWLWGPHVLQLSRYITAAKVSLHKTIARELSLSDGEEEGRKNSSCQLLHGNGNHVRTRPQRPDLEKHVGYCEEPGKSNGYVDFTIWLLSINESHSLQVESFSRNYENMASWFEPCHIDFCWLMFAVEFSCVIPSPSPPPHQTLLMIYVTPKIPMKVTIFKSHGSRRTRELILPPSWINCDQFCWIGGNLDLSL